MKNLHLNITIDSNQTHADLDAELGIGWIGSYEIKFDFAKREVYRIAIATTPPRCVSSACRPYEINQIIDQVLGFKRVGQAAN